MRQLTGQDRPSRPRRRRCYRWTSAEKAQYLEAYRRSGASVTAFCEAQDLSPATFAHWQRDARSGAHTPGRLRALARPTFARVEVIAGVAAVARASDAPPTRSGMMRLVVRGATGHEAALDGVDAATALQVVALVLEQRP